MAYGLKSRHRIGVSRCPLLPQKRSVVLLQTLHDVVGDEMTLIFGETLAQSPNRLATPHERKRNRKPQSVPSGSHLLEHKGNGRQQLRCR
jgi:hypothetical protein